ncbi:MAG: hypothetical protein ACP5N2_02670 [Candidatus Nanoarchaeia archaeon]
MYLKQNKKTKQPLKKTVHSPTLNTIRMVEKSLKNMDQSEIKIHELKKILPRKVNHNTLLEVLEYLDESNKILVGVRGITWVYNPSKKLQKVIKEGTEINPEDLRKFIKKSDKEK